MNENTSITIGDDMLDFARQQVAAGRYGSTSDVVHAGLRLLEEQEARLAALRSALVAGEASGPPEAFDFDRFIAERTEISGAGIVRSQ